MPVRIVERVMTLVLCGFCDFKPVLREEALSLSLPMTRFTSWLRIVNSILGFME
jgi:hypothetical protein